MESCVQIIQHCAKKMSASQNIENKPSRSGNRKHISRSKSKRRDGIADQSVHALLHVDDLDYKDRIIRPSNTSIKDQLSHVIKRDTIPALPSRHGSRADSIVPLHSQHSPARLRAEKILSKANEFHALFEDSDFSVLDRHKDLKEMELRMKKDARKPNSMAMNVWRANKVNPIPQTQTKTIGSQSNASSHSTPNHCPYSETSHSFHDDDSYEPSNSLKDSWMQAFSKVDVAHDILPQVTAKPLHMSKLRSRNDQVLDAVLHTAIMNDVVAALAQQPFQHHANPYVSLVDIKFATSINSETGSDGSSVINSKMLAKSGPVESKGIIDTNEKKKTSKSEHAKRSKTIKNIRESDRKISLHATDSTICDIRFQLESPFENSDRESPSPDQGQKVKESTTLPPLQHKARMVDAQKLLHEPSKRETTELKSQHCLSKREFELIGFTIASEENVERMESCSVLFEAIERNVEERHEICSDIDRYCLKLQKQWQTKQKTMLWCLSNTRLQGSARSRLLTFLRSLRQNQDNFFALVQQCHIFGSSGMSRKITHWKQEIDHHMHELVKLPTVADAINEIATEGKGKSNGFKSVIGTFSGCAKVDLATAAACSKLLLGSKDSKTNHQSDAEYFRIFGNNLVPSNGQISSIMLSPNEPLEEYKKVVFPKQNILP